MAQHSWTLLDTSQEVYLEKFEAKGTFSTPLGATGAWYVKKYRMAGGPSDGIDLVELHNGKISVFVMPTRGMGIWKVEIQGEAGLQQTQTQQTQTQQTLGWKSPVRGPVHPSLVPLGEPSGLGWLDGFNEFVCRCGLYSNGAPEFDENGKLIYGVHGRIANTPAWYVKLTIDEETQRLSLQGVVDEARFHFQKLRLTSTVTLDFNASTFSWTDQVTNYGSAPTEMQLLYHINLGEPQLEAGSRLVAPVQKMAPSTKHAATFVETWDLYPEPGTSDREQVFFFELLADASGKTGLLLKSPTSQTGVGVRFNKQELPYFIQWRNTPAAEAGYVTGLEPATNFPNTRSFETEQGRVVSLQPGETWQATIAVDWYGTPAEVMAAENCLAHLQKKQTPEIASQPRAGWSF